MIRRSCPRALRSCRGLSAKSGQVARQMEFSPQNVPENGEKARPSSWAFNKLKTPGWCYYWRGNLSYYGLYSSDGFAWVVLIWVFTYPVSGHCQIFNGFCENKAVWRILGSMLAMFRGDKGAWVTSFCRLCPGILKELCQKSFAIFSLSVPFQIIRIFLFLAMVMTLRSRNW